jgi:hypothetical protein
MTKLSKRLLMGLAVTVDLVVAITVVHAQRANDEPQQGQGGADSPERQAIQNTPCGQLPDLRRAPLTFSHSSLASGLHWNNCSNCHPADPSRRATSFCGAHV